VVAFGLILALVGVAGGALVAWLALQSSTGITLQWGGMAVTVLPITLFAAGAVAIVLLWAGWRLFRIGNRRRRAEREEIRALRTNTEAARYQPDPPTRPTPTATAAPAEEVAAPRSAQPAAEDVSTGRTVERPVRGPMD